ncbi:MAG: tol-pal system-associated acyl-CoA thioesterase [Aquabacterium sp.]|nr:MAG: tol-pal system-associated acyl-CoA thioesterase [Aquabacterium sp.]TAL20407.1 MAG: tol-pal system-associated acyl-CoA thioesterase [Aquabacterium sp.]
MSPANADFRHRLRIYWEDTDAGGIVFYANYLKFFERARTEWLRALGFSQQALRQETGGIFVVHATSVRYLRSARLDDELEISVEVTERARTGLTFFQQAWRGEELLAEGEIRIAWVAPAEDGGDAHRPRRIPQAILAALPQPPTVA